MSTWADITTATLAMEWKTRALSQLTHADLPPAGLETADDEELCFAFLEDGRLFMPIGADRWVILRDPTGHDGHLCCPGALVAHIVPTQAVADMVTQARRIRAAERRAVA